MIGSPIDEVIVLYNPVSTGNSKHNAQELIDQLHEKAPNLKVTLKKTEYSGHAEKLAQEYAKQKRPLLLVSSSGDGGYHELINGVLSSDNNALLTSLLPSGNANDHHRAVTSGALIEHIIAGTQQRLDVLKITAKKDGKIWVRYGHSYAGIGLTSVVGKELTKEKLNSINEKWVVLKHLLKFKHVSILVADKKIRYSSLVFSNVDQMSKVIRLSKESSMTDGKFEISAIRYESKFVLFKKLFQAVTIGLEETSSVSKYTFKTIKKLLIQIDGEDFTIDAHSNVEIQSVRKALHVIV